MKPLMFETITVSFVFLSVHTRPSSYGRFSHDVEFILINLLCRTAVYEWTSENSACVTRNGAFDMRVNRAAAINRTGQQKEISRSYIV